MTALPTYDRRAERRKATRQDILAAAWEVAHEDGLAALTLRAIAARVGMRPPSLYSHVASKNAVYDAMFEDGWRTYLDRLTALRRTLAVDPRTRLTTIALAYFDFAVADLARHQIMDVRTIADFEPSPAAYAPAVECYAIMRAEIGVAGVTDAADVDLFTALVAGPVSQQLANDPGGDRWRRLLPRAVAMFADDLGLPPTPAGPPDLPDRTRSTP